MYKIILIPLLFVGLGFSQEAIDMGSGGGNQGTATAVNYIYIDEENSANLTGTIDSLWFVADAEITNDSLIFGTCDLISGNNYLITGKAGVLIASVSAGDTVTLSAPGDFTAFDVEAGDYMCWEGPAGQGVTIKRSDDSGGTNLHYSAAAAKMGGSITTITKAGTVANERAAIQMLGLTPAPSDGYENKHKKHKDVDRFKRH